MENESDKKLIKKFYFKTEGEGFKCKFLNSEFNKFVVSDCEGYLYFYDTYLDSLIYENKPMAISPHQILNVKNGSIIYDFDLSQDNTQVIAGTSYQVAYLFDVNKMKQIQFFQNHTDSIKCVKFFKKNPNFLITGGKDGKLNYYDKRQKSKKYINLKTLQHERITGCDFFQDEKMIINSQTGTFQCFVHDLRKLHSYDSKKKRLQNNPEKCQLIEFNPQVYIESQLQYLNQQFETTKSVNQPSTKTLVQNYNLLKQNFDLENLHQKSDSQYKAITNIHLNHQYGILFTKDNLGNVFQYDLNYLYYSQPEFIGIINSSSLTNKLQIDQNLEKIVAGIRTDIHIWNLKDKNAQPYKHSHCHNEYINYVDISEYQNDIYLSVSDDKYGCLWQEE